MICPRWLSEMLRKIFRPVECAEALANKERVARQVLASDNERVAANYASSAIDEVLKMLEAERNGSH